MLAKIMKDPSFEKSAVCYIDDVGNATDKWGFKGPGWYFWDETWSQATGPYRNRKKAAQALQTYAELFLNWKPERQLVREALCH
jgi:hypothetical protein